MKRSPAVRAIGAWSLRVNSYALYQSHDFSPAVQVQQIWAKPSWRASNSGRRCVCIF